MKNVATTPTTIQILVINKDCPRVLVLAIPFWFCALRLSSLSSVDEFWTGPQNGKNDVGSVPTFQFGKQMWSDLPLTWIIHNVAILHATTATAITATTTSGSDVGIGPKRWIRIE
jgi:hypothetical protein